MQDSRQATELDSNVRQHLAMVLTIVQSGPDNAVVELARMETHRLIAAILAALRGHPLTTAGACAICGRTCELRREISRALMPVRLPTADRGRLAADG